MIKTDKTKASALWKTLNEVTSRKKSDPVSCIESDGIIYSDSKSIANIWNQHFSSVSSILVQKLKTSLNILLPSNSTVTTIDSNSSFYQFTPVSEEFVLKELKRLKPNKAIGLDGISARLMKDSAIVIYKSLTILYNRSLENGFYPAIWKNGKVVALFKSGDKMDSNNYRPITILPTMSKILERAVHRQLYDYMIEHNILSSKWSDPSSTGLI